MGIFDVLQRVWRTGQPERYPATLYRDERIERWFENYVYRLPGGEIVGVYDDVTERRRAEEEMRRLSRARFILSQCNEALVRAVNEEELLSNTCEMIRDIGGYGLVWVGFVDNEDPKTLRVAASSAEEPGYLENIGITRNPDAFEQSPVAISFRTKQPMLVQDTRTDPHCAPWREIVTQYGYLSVITLPLLTPESTLGALVIYAHQVDAFDSDEVALLMETAGDLAYGISSLRAQAARKQAEEALRESEERLRLFIEHAPVSLAMFDRDMCYLAYSQRWLTEFGHGLADLKGQAHYEIFPDIPEHWRAAHRRGLAGEIVAMAEDRLVWADGATQWLTWVVRPWHSATGAIGGIVIFSEDITERKRAEEELRRSEEQVRLKLDSLLSPDVELEEEELVNLLDIPALQALMDNFSELSHAVVAIQDTRGKVLLSSGWQDICTQFHRANPETAQNCTRSDLALSQRVRSREHVAYHCSNGLWDVVTPLMIGGKHVGNISTGQFFYEDDVIDEEAFAAQAVRFGFDPESYLAALHRVPRVSQEWVTTLMVFLTQFAELISKSSFSNLKLAKALAQQKRIEDDLRDSEEQFRAMFELASVGVAQADPRSKQFLRVNQRFTEITGYSGAELLQMQIPEITHPDDREQDAALFERVIRGDAADYRLEKRYVRKDGQTVWVNVNMTLIRDAEGCPLRAMATIEDITERKRAEEELRKLSMAVTQSPAVVVITDLNGNIEYVNPRFTEVTGYTFDEVLGRNPRILNSGETPRKEYEALWRTITSGGEWRGEFHNKKKDGTSYWERAFIAPIRDAEGAPTHFIAIKEEISQQKLLEEQYRQAQKMEGIGQLAGGVAHDFNNILQAILGYGQILLEKTPEQTKAHEYVEEIVRGAGRAAGLTRQLLAFSRRQVLDMRDLNIDDVVGNVSKMIRRLIGEDVELHIIPGSDLSMVRADVGQMEQVLMNLCVNARDAMPEGGRLTIETEGITLDEEYVSSHGWARPGRYVVLSVTDTGCGMTAETAAHVFEPFFTTKESGKGTGLGLATVYGIVNQHGGTIQHYSELGVGTTFKVYLPAADPGTSGVVVIPQKVRPKGGTETILVVEDDVSVRRIAVNILEGAGYTVLAAEEGIGALEVFERMAKEGGRKIDLVLSDVVMPRLGGKGLYDRLKNDPSAPRFLFSSGYSTNVVHSGFVLHEGIDLLQKPYAPSDLLRKIREVLDRPPKEGQTP